MEICNFLEDNKIEFRQNEMLKNHTSFKIGGKCDIMILPNSISKLVKLLKYIKSKHLPFMVLGNGTNVLFADAGFNGIVIKLGKCCQDYKITQKISNNLFNNQNEFVYNNKFVNNNEFINQEINSNQNNYENHNNLMKCNIQKCNLDNQQDDFQQYIIDVSAGMGLFDFCKLLRKNGLFGLEFLYGIPGSIGGAICMNAGAFGHSISERIKSVKIFDGEKIRTLKPNQLKFSYRKSIFENKNWVVLSARFELTKQDEQTIKALQEEYFQTKLNSQPYGYPSAGSVFKRLENGQKPLSKIIDDLGLKGTKKGGAEISTIHAGFIVNNGQATCKDVLDLIQYIKLKVKLLIGYEPQLEIKVIGENDVIIW